MFLQDTSMLFFLVLKKTNTVQHSRQGDCVFVYLASSLNRKRKQAKHSLNMWLQLCSNVTISQGEFWGMLMAIATKIDAYSNV